MLINLTVILQKYAAVERIHGNEYILLNIYQQIYVKSIWIEKKGFRTYLQDCLWLAGKTIGILSHNNAPVPENNGSAY